MPPMPPPMPLRIKNPADKRAEPVDPATNVPPSPPAPAGPVYSNNNNSSSSAPASQQQSSPLKRENITLNVVLESVFQMTLKSESANSIIKFMGASTGAASPGATASMSSLLTADKISELICSRLSTDGESGGAVGYLAGCYKRLLAKCSEHSGSTKIHDELVVLKGEVVSFVASSITVNEIFGSNSKDSVKDLYKLIAHDSASAIVEALLKDIVSEISDSTSEVMAEIIEMCVVDLDAKSLTGTRSVLDDMCISPPAVRVLQALCRADKAYAREVVVSKYFLVEQALQVSKPTANVPAFMLHNPATREPYSKAT